MHMERGWFLPPIRAPASPLPLSRPPRTICNQPRINCSACDALSHSSAMIQKNGMLHDATESSRPLLRTPCTVYAHTQLRVHTTTTQLSTLHTATTHTTQHSRPLPSRVQSRRHPVPRPHPAERIRPGRRHVCRETEALPRAGNVAPVRKQAPGIRTPWATCLLLRPRHGVNL